MSRGGEGRGGEGGAGRVEASVCVRYWEQEEEEVQRSSWVLFCRVGKEGGDEDEWESWEEKWAGLQAQAVFTRSCMAFCCVSFRLAMHGVHSTADVWWGGRGSRKDSLDSNFDFRKQQQQAQLVQDQF